MTEGVAFMDLARRDCRYPLGERDDPPTLFCGEPTRTGSPYCAFHHAVAYVRTRRAQPQYRQRQTPAMIEAGAGARKSPQNPDNPDAWSGSRPARKSPAFA